MGESKGRDGYLITLELFVPIPPRDMQRAVEAGRALARIGTFTMKPGDEKHYEVVRTEEKFVENFQGGANAET